MKVILKGINPKFNDQKVDSLIESLLKYTYPIEVVTHKGSIFFYDVVLIESETVFLDGEEWSLDWFDYEEIKEIKD